MAMRHLCGAFGGIFVKTISFSLLTALAALLLIGCGGGSSAASNPAPAAVVGVATPSSVAVVTAN
jgi:hypothetical protein